MPHSPPPSVHECGAEFDGNPKSSIVEPLLGHTVSTSSGHDESIPLERSRACVVVSGFHGTCSGDVEHASSVQVYSDFGVRPCESMGTA